MISVAEPFSGGLMMVAGLFLSADIADKCDSNKLPAMVRCLLVTELFCSNLKLTYPH